LAISITLTLVDLAGAVALLLWGVHMVQTGVQRAFGPQLRSFLSHTLRNRFKAFLAGLGVTAVLQSSTATGLMVAGFASEGLVALPSALAVMLGANVGTTLIVQLLSFDVVAVAPALILLGFLLFRRASSGPRDFGRVLIGLGLLLMALHQFLTLLGPLTADAMARDLLGRLSTHIVFIVLIGAILTWAAHSSIAIVLLAMSLAANGVLPIPAALALALGANVGTAINPILEGGAGGNPAGKRVALGNLLNRLFGVVAVLALFPYAAPLVTSVEAAPGRAVANFHTAFNLALALLFFPWLPLYARLLEKWIPGRVAQDAPGSPIYLDPAVRDTPAVALGAAAREALRMADVLEQMLVGLRGALVKSDRRQIEETKRLDDVLDRLNTAIKDYVMSIEQDRLSEADGHTLARILAFSINLEQAGDLIDRNLLGVVTRRLKRGLSFSPDGEADLVGQVDRLIATTRSAAALFLSGDERAAHALAHEKAAFRQIEEQAMVAHFQRLRSGDVETVETSSLHLDALRDLKRINAHLVEAAAYPILRQRGDLLPSRIRRLGGGVTELKPPR
jgi:phosphate:Na+ symporter